jgi:hypothetical protein
LSQEEARSESSALAHYTNRRRGRSQHQRQAVNLPALPLAGGGREGERDGRGEEESLHLGSAVVLRTQTRL